MAGTITALKAQKSAKDRVNVYLDGKFAFGLALIHALWLRVGQALDEAQIKELQEADTLEKAQQRALGLIAYRPRSVREVRERLKKADVAPQAIEDVIERLKSVGLLDDGEFSKTWVESRLRASPRGKRMIAWELKQKGVSDSAVAAALEGVDDGEAAYRAALKRQVRLAALTPQERKRKLHDFLARSGFDYNIIEDTLRRIETLDD